MITSHTPRKLGINRRYRAILPDTDRKRYSVGLSPLAQTCKQKIFEPELTATINPSQPGLTANELELT